MIETRGSVSTVNSAVMKRWSMIMAQDCPPFVRKFSARTGLTLDEGTLLWGELVKFLLFCAFTPNCLSPSLVVDELWHDFLIDTREYRKFCQTMTGRFIDHVPLENPNPDAYQNSLRLIEASFGYRDHRFWPSSTSAASGCDGGGMCGSSCSD
jgi:hypothetical protein